ncbi:MAG: T9SS type A sorting domain-containing protein [Saprospiraceae bacterium]|nr:T9SS type A sorting domain-containing protein [Saprospiraceae bacterium]
MQKIIECFFFVFLAINSLAQTVLAIGEVGAEEAVEVIVYNDVFVVGGTYQQQLGNDVCKGNSDVFLQQYDVYGQLNWQYVFGGNNNELLKALTCASDGSIYSASVFSDSLFYTNSDTIVYSLQQAVIINKHDQQGDLIWAKCLNAQSLVNVEDIVCDLNDNIYITGSFQDTFMLDSTLQLNGTSKNDVFLIKIDKGGTILWARQSTFAEEAEGTALAIDSLNNVYLGGNFKGDFSMMQDSFQAHWVYPDIFLCKVDSIGNFLWQKHFGGAYDNNCKEIKWVHDYLYLGGNFKGSLNIDSIELATAYRDWDAFITKLDLNGDVLWASQSQTESDCFLEDFCVTENYLIICGSFNDYFLWENLQVQSSSSSDAFQLIMNDAGQEFQVNNWSGNGFDLAKAIDCHRNGSVITVGAFQNDINFIDTNLIAQGFSDAFISIQDPISVPYNVIGMTSFMPQLKIFPNPASHLLYLVCQNGDINHWIVYNTMGQIVLKGKGSEVFLGNLNNEAYLLQVFTSQGIIMSKFVIKE